MGIPIMVDKVVKANAQIVTATIIFLMSESLSSLSLRMIFSERVVLTCLEQRYAPMNSNTDPRIRLYTKDKAPLEKAVESASVSFEPIAKLIKKERADMPQKKPSSSQALISDILQY
ncbi:hypothetical protein FGO68_gene12553 [Halteria grandinella]|uniref:Uncharacterized protein n=1 Tax=Halteria grandinella TaxID=5974 RepID=A0A8J8T314_HALGN|nr:hypothetical protein FGO68_gene12553 [Halteria grandinella]